MLHAEILSGAEFQWDIFVSLIDAQGHVIWNLTDIVSFFFFLCFPGTTLLRCSDYEIYKQKWYIPEVVINDCQELAKFLVMVKSQYTYTLMSPLFLCIKQTSKYLLSLLPYNIWQGQRPDWSESFMSQSRETQIRWVGGTWFSKTLKILKLYDEW